MEELFYRYNPWWEEQIHFKDILPRDRYLKALEYQLNSRSVVVLTGLRRVGKTTLLKILIQHLITEKNIDPARILYLSLDDYQLGKTTILEIVEFYRKLHNLSFKDNIFLFFDEITYHRDFEQQLKNLYDSQNVKIIVSSSSASVINSRKPFLTGRSVLLEILPLDFDEYLVFKNIKISKSNQHLVEGYFENYLKHGGMPEYVLQGDIAHLRELVDDILFKDIAAFHNIKRIQELKDYFLLLMERAGKMISLNKISKILSIAPDTAKRYLQLFSDTYLIDIVPRYGKTNETLLSPKKVYAADLGIRTLFTGFRDKGSLFENYVYLKIKTLEPRYVYADGQELDFFTSNKVLIEVKYNSEMTDKQSRLFKKLPARKKILIKNIHDLKLLNHCKN